LQLPLYALAVQEALDLGEVAEGLYWALLKGEAGSLKLSSFKSEEDGLPDSEDGFVLSDTGPQAAIRVATTHLKHIVNGIRQAHFSAVAPKGGCPVYCPSAAWCWHYVPGWGA
jgi:hypothetical protein